MQEQRKRTRRRRAQAGRGRVFWGSAFRGAVIGLLITVAGVLAFALIIKETAPGDEIIAAVDECIKVASVMVAAWLAARRASGGPLLSGLTAGVMYVVLGFFAFSLIEGAFGDLRVLLADLAMGALIGLLAAAAATRVFGGKKPAGTRA